jgi:hypothetical protein
MTISFDQFKKALERERVAMSDAQMSRILNDLLPNPQSGLSVGGVNVWGDAKSIDVVRRWHHDATARLPAIETRWQEDRDNMEQAREVIIEANNSLYGSQSYFLGMEGKFDKYHLARPIEDLKAKSRKPLPRVALEYGCKRYRVRYKGQFGWTHYVDPSYINLKLDSGANRSVVPHGDVEFLYAE